MADTIVVPLDGSALAERALPYAAALADLVGGGLLLLRAVPGSDMAGAEAYLAATAARLGAAGRQVGCAARCGDPARVIARESRAPGVRLVAMSTHGTSGRGRWLFGATADEVLRQAGAPVLLVPAGGTPRWERGEPRRLLVPLDGSALAEAALEPAAVLARELAAALTLLRVIETPYAPIGYEATPGEPGGQFADAQLYLEQRAAPLRASGLPVTTRVEAGYPAAAIAATARNGAMLIALATHGYGGSEQVVLGSIATGIVQQADGPVLLVRPRSLRQANGGATANDRLTLAVTPDELALIARALRGLPVGDEAAEPARVLLDRLSATTAGAAH